VPRERVWSTPQDRITDPDVARQLGRIERDASGQYEIFDGKGQRIGIGKPRPDGTVELYDAQGRRGLPVKPEKPRRR
jgi:hypothetical protein